MSGRGNWRNNRKKFPISEKNFNLEETDWTPITMNDENL